MNIKELTAFVENLGLNSGGGIDVTGTWKGEPRTIRVEQTEWHDSPVCLVGGYGNDVSVVNPDDLASGFDCVIGNYLDSDTFSVA